MVLLILAAVSIVAAIYFGSTTLVAIIRLSVIPFVMVSDSIIKKEPIKNSQVVIANKCADFLRERGVQVGLIFLVILSLGLAVYQSATVVTADIDEPSALWERQPFLIYLCVCCTLLFAMTGLYCCCCCKMILYLPVSLTGNKGKLVLFAGLNGLNYGYFLVFLKLFLWTWKEEGMSTEFFIYGSLLFVLLVFGELVRQGYLGLDIPLKDTIAFVVSMEVSFGVLTSSIFFDEFRLYETDQLLLLIVCLASALVIVCSLWYFYKDEFANDPTRPKHMRDEAYSSLNSFSPEAGP